MTNPTTTVAPTPTADDSLAPSPQPHPTADIAASHVPSALPVSVPRSFETTPSKLTPTETLHAETSPAATISAGTIPTLTPPSTSSPTAPAELVKLTACIATAPLSVIDALHDALPSAPNDDDASTTPPSSGRPHPGPTSRPDAWTLSKSGFAIRRPYRSSSQPDIFPTTAASSKPSAHLLDREYLRAISQETDIASPSQLRYGGEPAAVAHWGVHDKYTEGGDKDDEYILATQSILPLESPDMGDTATIAAALHAAVTPIHVLHGTLSLRLAHMNHRHLISQRRHAVLLHRRQNLLHRLHTHPTPSSVSWKIPVADGVDDQSLQGRDWCYSFSQVSNQTATARQQRDATRAKAFESRQKLRLLRNGNDELDKSISAARLSIQSLRELQEHKESIIHEHENKLSLLYNKAGHQKRSHDVTDSLARRTRLASEISDLQQRNLVLEKALMKSRANVQDTRKLCAQSETAQQRARQQCDAIRLDVQSITDKLHLATTNLTSERTSVPALKARLAHLEDICTAASTTISATTASRDAFSLHLRARFEARCLSLQRKWTFEHDHLIDDFRTTLELFELRRDRMRRSAVSASLSITDTSDASRSSVVAEDGSIAESCLDDVLVSPTLRTPTREMAEYPEFTCIEWPEPQDTVGNTVVEVASPKPGEVVDATSCGVEHTPVTSSDIEYPKDRLEPLPIITELKGDGSPHNYPTSAVSSTIVASGTSDSGNERVSWVQDSSTISGIPSTSKHTSVDGLAEPASRFANVNDLPRNEGIASLARQESGVKETSVVLDMDDTRSAGSDIDTVHTTASTESCDEIANCSADSVDENCRIGACGASHKSGVTSGLFESDNDSTLIFGGGGAVGGGGTGGTGGGTGSGGKSDGLQVVNGGPMYIVSDCLVSPTTFSTGVNVVPCATIDPVERLESAVGRSGPNAVMRHVPDVNGQQGKEERSVGCSTSDLSSDGVSISSSQFFSLAPSRLSQNRLQAAPGNADHGDRTDVCECMVLSTTTAREDMQSGFGNGIVDGVTNMEEAAQTHVAALGADEEMGCGTEVGSSGRSFQLILKDVASVFLQSAIFAGVSPVTPVEPGVSSIEYCLPSIVDEKVQWRETGLQHTRTGNFEAGADVAGSNFCEYGETRVDYQADEVCKHGVGFPAAEPEIETFYQRSAISTDRLDIHEMSNMTESHTEASTRFRYDGACFQSRSAESEVGKSNDDKCVRSRRPEAERSSTEHEQKRYVPSEHSNSAAMPKRLEQYARYDERDVKGAMKADGSTLNASSASSAEIPGLADRIIAAASDGDKNGSTTFEMQSSPDGVETSIHVSIIDEMDDRQTCNSPTRREDCSMDPDTVPRRAKRLSAVSPHAGTIQTTNDFTPPHHDMALFMKGEGSTRVGGVADSLHTCEDISLFQMNGIPALNNSTDVSISNGSGDSKNHAGGKCGEGHRWLRAVATVGLAIAVAIFAMHGGKRKSRPRCVEKTSSDLHI